LIVKYISSAYKTSLIFLELRIK